MDKAVFIKKINKAKERMYQMHEVATGTSYEGKDESASIKLNFDEQLISWALLNMPNKKFNEIVKKIKKHGPLFMARVPI